MTAEGFKCWKILKRFKKFFDYRGPVGSGLFAFCPSSVFLLII
jgi:hypothetical protein